MCDVPWVQGTFRGGSLVKGHLAGECIQSQVGLDTVYAFTVDIVFCICNEHAI